jgi:hypothetical protein
MQNEKFKWPEVEVQHLLVFPDGYHYIAEEDVERYRRDPEAFLLKYFNTTSKWLRAYLNFLTSSGYCNAVTRKGVQCSNHVSTYSFEFKDFVPGISDRCSRHQGRELPR